MSLSRWLDGLMPDSAAEIRAEIWGLGARHLGRPLDGALEELARPDLSPERARLLRACVRKLRDG